VVEASTLTSFGLTVISESQTDGRPALSQQDLVQMSTDDRRGVAFVPYLPL
jgi:hypothetical protein